MRAPGDPAAWSALDRVLDGHDRFLLVTHINPDGDGLGSELALALHLAAIGKSVRIVNASPVPRPFAFLQEGAPRVEIYDERVHRSDLLVAPCIVVLDTAEWSRLGRLEPAVRDSGGTLLVVDHHVAPAPMGHAFLSVPTASSTGELIYHALVRRGQRITPAISRALFVAIATDTGWFRYENTSADVLRIAAALIDAGAQPREIFRQVYENTTWDDVELFRALVGSLKPACDGKVAVIHVDRDLYERYAACDMDRILDYALSIPNIEIVLFFKQVASTATKLSLRSRGTLDIGDLARRHGGGGHRNAAGVLAQTGPKALETQILADVRALLERARA